MIEFASPHGPLRIVEDLSDLPDLRKAHKVYADSETTSFSDREMAVHPYMGHRACGWAITADNHVGAWYVPIRHRSPGARNLDPAAVSKWLGEVLSSADQWVNHFVKFDAHVAHVDGVSFESTELWCTNNLAKTIDSDRFGHQLKPLLREWVGMETPEETKVKQYLESIKLPRNAKCKDYGRVPIDVLGVYACVDVIGARALMNWLIDHRPEGMERLWKTETQLTSVLFDMERDGLFVDRENTILEKEKALTAMVLLATEFKRLTGRELTDSNKCFHETLCGSLGLPVLAYTENKKSKTRQPSFDRATLDLYAGHPAVLSDPEGAGLIVRIITRFRKWQTYHGLFLDPFLERVDEKGLLHSNYNQCIRTGRMSCKDPNAQQFDERAAALIIPEKDRVFLCGDASQMEFRLIAHYIRDETAIKAYADDPNTDFHQWVANLCGVQRSPGKTLNFAMGYGAGRKRVTHLLSHNKDVMAEVSLLVDAAILRGDVHPQSRAGFYASACAHRADELYLRYHERLPGIKATMEKAAGLCRRRGWIRNAYGRRRHLPPNASYRALNSLVQGCAMDAVKRGMVSLSPRFNPDSREMGLRLLANKHDEVLADVPREALGDEKIKEHFVRCLEDVGVEFRVPIVWHAGWSEESWAKAKP